MALDVLRTHDRIVRDSVELHDGRVVKHTGDGVMACFSSVAHAIESAIAIARRLNEHNLLAEHAIAVRVGLSAGEPVTENADLLVPSRRGCWTP